LFLGVHHAHKMIAPFICSTPQILP
jgi:hypothetical protein